MTTTDPDPRRWKALALLCLAGFMIILDAQVVILALPSIAADLGFAEGNAQWVMSAYLLSFGGLLLLGGRIADLRGRRRVFMTGTALFLLSSLLCGLAWSAGILVAARIVQGVSAAIMAPTALSILMNTFEEGPDRNKALAAWSGSSGFGATAALLIGGPLTHSLGWQWIFFLNVPVAAILLSLGPILLRESRATDRTHSFDLVGAATITAALVACVYAVVEAPDAGWLSPTTLGLLAASAALTAVFVRIEGRTAAPLVPLRLLRTGTVSAANLVVVLLGSCAFGMSFIVSQYGQEVLDYSPMFFGLSTAVMPAMAAAGSYAGQALVTRLGPRPVAAGGLVLVGLGGVLLSQVRVEGSYFGDLFGGLLLFGAGLGACAVAGSIAALSGVAERESGLASGLNTVAFQIGGAFGVAIASSVAVSYTSGTDPLAALAAGHRAAFTACAMLAATGTALALLLLARPLRNSEPSAQRHVQTSKPDISTIRRP